MAAHSLQHHQAGQARMTEGEANEMIKKYDKNGDAILTKQELTSLILDQASQKTQRGGHKDVGCKPQNVPAKAPDNQLGFRMKLSRDEIREIFLEHDIDGDGYLTVKEMTKAFSCIGSMLPFYKAHYGLKFADADGDGLISEEELEKLIDYAEKVSRRKGFC